MTDVPQGNTQKGVNNEVFRLLQTKGLEGAKSVLDLPCGEGKFSRFLKTQFPNLNVIGVDAVCEVENANFQFTKSTANTFMKSMQPQSYDAVVCISGVMCFDNLMDVFSTVHASLKPGGLFVVTNDNILTVRDRFNFLFFGNFKRFKILFSKNEGNWNVVLPQALLMLFQRHNFKNIEVSYTSVYTEDWLFLPLALLIYPFVLLRLLTIKSELAISQRRRLFPFRSMLARHYIVSATK